MQSLLLALLLAAPTLSTEALDGYRNGTGMGMALPAERNGYPGPRHILDLGDHLGLTADQRQQIQSIYDAMHAEAVRLGGEIIEMEQKLDGRFADHTMTAPELEAITKEIAARQGRLRYVHLKAHLAAKEILTASQIDLYMRHRGHAH